MARVVEYTAPEGDTNIRPSETGAEARFRTGRIVQSEARLEGQEIGGAISQVGGEVGRIVYEHASQSQTTNSAAKGIELNDKLGQAWEEAQKGADPHHIQETRLAFLDNFAKPIIQQYQDAHGWTDADQKFRQGQGERYLDHLSATTGADVIGVAGDTLKADITKFKDVGGSAIMRDPSSLKLHMGELDQAMDNLTSSIPGLSAKQMAAAKTEVAESIKQEFTRSAFYGIARTSTAAARKFALDPANAEHLNGPEINQFLNTMDRQDKQLAATKRVEDRLAHQQQQSDAMTGWLEKGAVIGPDGKPTGEWHVTPGMRQEMVQLMHDRRVDPGNAEKMLAYTRADVSHNQEIVTDPALQASLMQRSAIPLGQPGALTDMELATLHGQNKVSNDTVKDVHANQELANNNPLFKAAADQLQKNLSDLKGSYTNSAFGKADARGDTAYATAYNQAMARLRQAYQTNPNAPIDPLFDATAQNYLLRGLDPQTLKSGMALRSLGSTPSGPAAAAPNPAPNVPTGSPQGPIPTSLPRAQRKGETDVDYMKYLNGLPPNGR